MAHNACSEAGPSLWRGQVFVRAGFAVFFGESGHAESHRHWAHQVTLGCGEPVTLVCDGQERSAPGFLVRAGVEHCLAPGHVLSVYVDAGVAGVFDMAGAERPSEQQIEALTEVACSAWRERAHAALTNNDASLVRSSPQRYVDSSSTARATQVHAAIRGALSECSAMGLADLAAELGLSSSRFSHWFSETTGLPFRSYKKWVRLVVAMEELATNGADLTRAAHSAGFADSAHLSRTFRLAFGLSPSKALRQVDLVGMTRDL